MKAFLYLLAVMFAVRCASAQKIEPIYQGKSESFWINALSNRVTERYLIELGSNALPVLLKAVGKQNGPNAEIIRSNAVRLIAFNTRSNALLITFLKKNRNANVRKFSAEFLATIPDRAVTLALIEALKDKDKEVRSSAAFALGMCERGETVVVPPLTKVLTDKDSKVRVYAGSVLIRYESGRKAALPELVKALKDPDPELRNFAEAFLKDIAPGEIEKARAIAH